MPYGVGAEDTGTRANATRRDPGDHTMRLGRPTDSIRFDLEDRPTKRVERGALAIALFSIPFGAFFAWFPTAVAVAAWAEDELTPSTLALLPFFLVGVAAFGHGVAQLTARREVEIGEDEVVQRERLFVRDRVWREPLSAYRGIRLRRERPRVRENQGQLVLYCVDLVHPDRTRNVELYRSRSKARWRDEAERAAATLGVPVADTPATSG